MSSADKFALPVAIAAITPDEVDELRRFVLDYWQELMPNASVMHDPARQAAYWVQRFNLAATGDAAGSRYWWAILHDEETAGEKIGFAKLDLEQDHDGGWAQIHDFYIVPAQRCQGYGRAFLDLLLDQLRQAGIERIDLNVRQDNPAALAFWQHVGFNPALYRLRCYLD